MCDKIENLIQTRFFFLKQIAGIKVTATLKIPINNVVRAVGFNQ